MTKRYRLLKDLPNAKAGTELQGYNTMSYTYRGKDGVVNTYHKSFVENNPEWFEEIKEEQPFQWDEALVWDVIREHEKSHTKNIQHTIDQFKASKVDWERNLSGGNPSKQQTNTIPSGDEKLYSRCLVCCIAIKEGAKYCGSHWRSYQPPPTASDEVRVFTGKEKTEAEEKAFYEARFTHPMLGFKHKNFEDYKKQNP